jgi:hypothetical protein
LLVPDVDELEPLFEEPELLEDPLDVEPLVVPDPVLPVVVDFVSLANVRSCAACTPLADGSLTLSAQCVKPLAFCAAVGGQYALAFEPTLPS